VRSITCQSSGRPFRFWHFGNFRVGRYVLANLFKVVVLIIKLANCTCGESKAQFAKIIGSCFLSGIAVMGRRLSATPL
jgi:membrane-associated PAP2 superfamily phosphatase